MNVIVGREAAGIKYFADLLQKWYKPGTGSNVKFKGYGKTSENTRKRCFSLDPEPVVVLLTGCTS